MTAQPEKRQRVSTSTPPPPEGMVIELDADREENNQDDVDIGSSVSATASLTSSSNTASDTTSTNTQATKCLRTFVRSEKRSNSNILLECDLCDLKVWNFINFASHLEKKHNNNSSVTEAVKSYRAGLQARKPLSTDKPKVGGVQTSIEHFAVHAHVDKERMHAAVARYVVECDLPFSHVDNPAFQKLMNQTCAFSRSTASSSYIPPNRKSLADNHIFGPQGLVETIVGGEIDFHITHARAFGTLLISDGRTNINGACIDAYLLEGASGSLFIDNVDPRDRVKNAAYYTESWRRFLSHRQNEVASESMRRVDQLLCTVVGIATDGASASISGALKASQEFGVITVRCAVHNLNRVLVHQVEKVPLLKEAWKKYIQVLQVYF
jgi:hypothetical protein